MLLTLVVTSFMVHQVVTRFRINASTEALLAADSEAGRTLEILRDDFGQDETFLIVAAGDVFSMDYLNRLKALQKDVEAISIPLKTLGLRKSERGLPPAEEAHAASPVGDEDFGDFAGEKWSDAEGWGDEAGGVVVDEVLSLINLRRTVWKDGVLRTDGWLHDWPTAAELPELKRVVMSNDRMVRRWVDREGKSSVLVIRTAFMNEPDLHSVSAHLETILEKHRAPNFRLAQSGSPPLNAALGRTVQADFERMFALSTLGILVILAFLFRHPMGIVGPLLVVVQAAIWTFGTMAMSGIPLTMTSNVLPSFLIAVGVGDSIHLQSVYREYRREGMENRRAIVRALGGTGIPIVYTTLTTAVALLSFQMGELESVRDMGLFGAFGVMMALLHSVVFLPIVLSFNTRSVLGATAVKDGDVVARALGWCDSVSHSPSGGATRGRNFIILTGLLVGLVSTVGATRLAPSQGGVEYLPLDHPARVATHQADELYGGVDDIRLLIDAKDGGNIKNREFMLALAKLEGEILAYRDPLTGGEMATSVISVLDVVRETHRATHGNADDAYRVPDTQRGVVDMMTLFENSSPEDLRKLVTVDLNEALITIRVRLKDARDFPPLVDHVVAAAEAAVGPKYRVRPTGTVLTHVSVILVLLWDLVKSFASALLVITVMIILLLRDFRLGMVSMVPNLLPILMVLGLMGYSGIPLDMSTLLIASIAIGIAVDDTVHFAHQFKAYYDLEGDVDEALAASFRHAGRAMMSTSLLLLAGFGVYLTAEVTNLKYFGLLVGFTVIAALFADLVLFPALLRVMYSKKARSAGSGGPQGD
ncbi:MAG: MMPL family transporter [Polyangiaceae bacterium]|nr:MMPL family transporter [Polyangiaceae bacterium]